jgi:hypothetical protein
MSNRDQIRAQMNSHYFSLPTWIAEGFLPLRDAVSILFDRGDDALARNLVAAIPAPAGIDEQRSVEFAASQSSLLNGIDQLISTTDAGNPLRSPEALAMAALAAERRAS